MLKFVHWQRDDVLGAHKRYGSNIEYVTSHSLALCVDPDKNNNNTSILSNVKFYVLLLLLLPACARVFIELTNE